MEPDTVLRSQFEGKIDAALRSAGRRRQWPCTIGVYPEHYPITEEVMARYDAVGWSVALVSAQRPDEPSFLRFEKPRSP